MCVYILSISGCYAIGFNFIAGEHKDTSHAHCEIYYIYIRTHTCTEHAKRKGGGFSLSHFSFGGCARSLVRSLAHSHIHIRREPENKIMASSSSSFTNVVACTHSLHTMLVCPRAVSLSRSLAIISIRNIWRNNETPQEICGAHDTVPPVRWW